MNYSYEDFLEVSKGGENTQEIAKFCEDAVLNYMSTDKYKDALDAEQYFLKHNVTIETYVKWLYTISGRKQKDIYSADNRMKTHFFRRKVKQHENYILGNGIRFTKDDTKDKLGKNIEHQIKKLFEYASICGESYGFWNVDHLEVFAYTRNENHAGFCPIYSEDTGEMMAGIRHRCKKVGNVTITFYMLYEPDGITQYKKNSNDKEFTILKPKYKYINNWISTKAEGVILGESTNYTDNKLPVIPFVVNDERMSEFEGMRESIDCYDLIKNGLANNIDDASEIYWIVKNAGGMNDVKLSQFLQRLKTVHAASVDSDDSGTGVEAKTIDVPFEARKYMLEQIRNDIYDDWMLLDRRSMSAAEKTTQELEMAYQPQDDYINDVEFCIYDFIDNLLDLVGIDDEATFSRNKVVNKKEITNMVLSSANYVSPECIIEHLPFLTLEEQAEEIEKLEAESIERFHDVTNEEEENEDAEEVAKENDEDDEN